MSDEIPFKFVRYQNTDNGVFDVKNDAYCDNRICANLLNNYDEVVAELDLELEEKQKRIEELEYLEEYSQELQVSNDLLKITIERLREELRLALN